MKNYDVIIVGGGPAGIAAAKIFNDNSINYCIIDSKKFPREKLCGGGLTHKTITILKRLGLSIASINKNECHNIRLIAKHVDTLTQLDNSTIMVNRSEFDYNNIKQVTNNNLFEEEKIISIENKIITTDNNQYKFKYLIFSDGVNGYSRKLIKNRKFGFCLEYDTSEMTKEVVFDFSAIQGGYGWIFPKSNGTTIGIGHMNQCKANYMELLTEFAKKYNFTIDKERIKGYHIPIFSEDIYKETVINNDTIIVGDAAALVNQISGEGIYYALSSGMNAALSIIECMNNNKNLKDIYFSKNEGLVNTLRKISKASKLLYSKRGNIYIIIALKNKKIMKNINQVLG